jgi:tetratricopeptide (TPR) repeat protein
VASYETAAPAGADGAVAAADPDVDPKIVEHLRALGYLETSSPKGERNLAALHFEKGEYAEAARIYEVLVGEEPDDASLHASLAGALGALGRLDESLAALDRAIALDPANPEAHHNRGVIHEKRGDPVAAARDYEIALRYAPDYEPSQRALVRLRGFAAADEPKSANEKLAAAIAERAHGAALRGDYAGAMKQLDEAERIAPGFARIFHYRSNVAYLMGDRTAAVTALRRAVELEPENPLFRANLERLERPDGGGAPALPRGGREAR